MCACLGAPPVPLVVKCASLGVTRPGVCACLPVVRACQLHKHTDGLRFLVSDSVLVPMNSGINFACVHMSCVHPYVYGRCVC